MRKCVISLLIVLSIVLSCCFMVVPGIAYNDELEQFIAEQIDLLGSNEAEYIDCSSFSSQYESQTDLQTDINAAIQKINKYYPEYFFCNWVQTKNYVYLYFNYISYDTETLFNNYALLKEKSARIINSMPNDLNDYEKALYLHDYVIDNTVADTSVSNSKQGKCLITDSILDGVGTSKAYSLAYQYLLKLAGIKALTIQDYSNSNYHHFNALLLNNKWYYVDTYNDDTSDGRINHKNFLINNSEIEDSYPSSSWSWQFDNYSEATDTTYSNDVVKTSKSNVYFDNGDYKFLNNSGEFISYNVSDKSSTVVYTVNEKWKSFGEGGGYYAPNYSLLTNIHDLYLISTPTQIIAVDQNGNCDTVYTSNHDDANIYRLSADKYYNINIEFKQSNSAATLHNVTIGYFDLNLNGAVDAADLTLLRQYIVGVSDLNELQIKIADINNDGYIMSDDVLLMKQRFIIIQ